jgi:hypothetical protein
MDWPSRAVIKRPNLLILGLGMYLRVAINLYLKKRGEASATGHHEKKVIQCLPDVLVNRKRAFVRFARPSMFKVPWNDVLIVFTGLN